MADNEELMRAIGRLEGKMDSVITGQARHDITLRTINDDLGKVKTKAAINAVASGSFVSVGISLLIAKLKMFSGS